MLQDIDALIVLLPRFFDIFLIPAVAVSSLLVLRKRTRSAAASSFFAIAAISLSCLSMTAASIVYVGWRFSHVVFDLLMNVGPSATFDFLESLLRVAGVRPIDFAPMLAAAIGSAIAAFALSLRRGGAGRLHEGLESLAEPQPSAS